MPLKNQYAFDLHLEFSANEEFRVLNQNLHNKVDRFIVQKQLYEHGI